MHQLHDLLNYKSSAVVKRVEYEYGVPEDDGAIIFSDLLRFIWFSNNVKDKSLATIDRPIVILDIFWHTFLLFTEEYMKFCHQHFGRYMHHSPNTSENAESIEHAALLEKTRRKYESVYNMLGEETFKRWYLEYPEKYSIEKICAMRSEKLKSNNL